MNKTTFFCTKLLREAFSYLFKQLFAAMVTSLRNKTTNLLGTRPFKQKNRKMAHQMAFPFLYIKLSGEMIYIIEQRLEGTNPAVKAFPAPSVFHLRPMASYFYC